MLEADWSFIPYLPHSVEYWKIQVDLSPFAGRDAPDDVRAILNGVFCIRGRLFHVSWAVNDTVAIVAYRFASEALDELEDRLFESHGG